VGPERFTAGSNFLGAGQKAKTSFDSLPAELIGIGYLRHRVGHLLAPVEKMRDAIMRPGHPTLIGGPANGTMSYDPVTLL
jgi:hypothetical protein